MNVCFHERKYTRNKKSESVSDVSCLTTKCGKRVCSTILTFSLLLYYTKEFSLKRTWNRKEWDREYIRRG